MLFSNSYSADITAELDLGILRATDLKGDYPFSAKIHPAHFRLMAVLDLLLGQP